MNHKTMIQIESDDQNGLMFTLHNEPELSDGTVYDDAPRAAQVGHMVDLLTDLVQLEGPDAVLAVLASLKAESDKKRQAVAREADGQVKH